MIRLFSIILLIILFLFWAPRLISLFLFDATSSDGFKESKHQPIELYYRYGVRTMHAVSIGDSTNPTVLFIHGSPGEWNNFVDFFLDSQLTENYHLISVDRPGFGQSGFGNPMPDLKEQAASIQSLLIRYRQSPKPMVIGHSLGGPVAARLSMDYPGEVGHLVLVSASVDPELEPEEWFRPILQWPVIRSIIPGELYASNMELINVKKYLYAMDTLWYRTTASATIIHGKNDMLVPFENVRYATEKLAHVPLDSIYDKQMNHFVPWSHPEYIKQTINKYFGHVIK